MNSFTKRPLPPSRQPKASFIESKELNLPSCRNFETYPPLLIFCLTPSDPPLPRARGRYYIDSQLFKSLSLGRGI